MPSRRRRSASVPASASTSTSKVSRRLAKPRRAWRAWAASSARTSARAPRGPRASGTRRAARSGLTSVPAVGAGAQRGDVAQERAQRGQQQRGVVRLLERLRGLHPAHRVEAVERARAVPRAPRAARGSSRTRSRSAAPRLPPATAARRARLVLVEPLALAQGRRHRRPRQRAEAQHLAARADRLAQAERRPGDEHDVRPRRRLLEALQQRVLRRLVHRVGVVDHEHAAAGLEGRPGDLADEVADLVDADLGLGPRPARPREPPALGEHEVGVEAEVAPDVLVGVAVGLARAGPSSVGLRAPRPPGGTSGTRRTARAPAPARTGPPARPRARASSCRRRPGPAKSIAGRQPVALERAREDRPDALVAADVGEPHAPRLPHEAAGDEPGHSASNTASSGLRAVERAASATGSSARSASKPARTRSWNETRSASSRSCAPRRPTRARPDLDGHVDEHDQVGPQAAGGERGEPSDGLERQAAAVALVREARLDVAVAEHHAALGRAPAGSPRPRSARGRRSRAAARSSGPSRGSRGRAARRAPPRPMAVPAGLAGDDGLAGRAAAASRRSCVVLPQPSMPSNVMNGTADSISRPPGRAADAPLDAPARRRIPSPHAQPRRDDRARHRWQPRHRARRVDLFGRLGARVAIAYGRDERAAREAAAEVEAAGSHGGHAPGRPRGGRRGRAAGRARRGGARAARRRRRQPRHLEARADRRA